VAGREDRGLTNEELDRCQALVTIETAPQHRSLNLAHAVGILCYETWLAREGGEVPLKPPRRESRPAPGGRLELLFRDWERALWAIEFFKTRQPDTVMRSLREAIFRAGLDWREASLLRAMALETVRFLERSGTPFELPGALRDVGRIQDSGFSDEEKGPNP
jgi:tRNA (cytidine32/uridine32-2'-O)-methyltransferase